VRAPRNPWPGLYLSAWALGLEATTVIGLRTARIAAGGEAGAAESRLMVSEKVAAAFDLQAKAAGGALGTTPAGVTARTLSHYRRVVRANRRRLSKT
jgi:hypothetical protein